MSDPAEQETPIMFEESEGEDYELLLNDRSNSRVEVKSGTYSQDVWLATSPKISRSKSKERMKRPRSLEDLSKLVPDKKELKADGQKRGSSKSKKRRPRSGKSRSKSRNGSRSLSPKRSTNGRSKFKSLSDGSKDRSRKSKKSDGKDDELDSRSTNSQSRQKKDSSSKSLDPGNRHRSRNTIRDSLSIQKKDSSSKSLDPGNRHRSRNTNRDRSGDELRAIVKKYQQRKGSDQEREDNDTKKRERRARSISPVPKSRSRDTNKSNMKKESRGKRALRPGVEHRSESMEDRKERRNREATAVGNSSENDRTNRKAIHRTAQRVGGAQPNPNSRSVPSVSSQTTTEGLTLHAEAVDENMNARIIQEQVQAALAKMTSHERVSGSGSGDDNPRRCMTGPRMCLLAFLLLIGFVGGGFAIFVTLTRANKPPVATGSPTAAPTTTEIVPPPTTPSLINEDNCVALKGDADIVSFDIQMEILVDDEGNYAGTMANIILAIQQDIVPGLTGCAQTLQRRLKESFRFLRRNRGLQNTNSSLANVTGAYGDSGSCGANATNVTNATNTHTTHKFCRSLTLTIDAATNTDSNSSEMILLIENALNPEELDLPGNATIGQLEVYPLTTRSPSSMPSITTVAPTLSPSTSPTASSTITLSENPTRAPVSWPTTEEPTRSPSKSPSPAPSPSPTLLQSQSPTKAPTVGATPLPTEAPSPAPTPMPSFRPSLFPTESPSYTPSVAPSASLASPSTGPSMSLSSSPSTSPSVGPSVTPSTIPTSGPTEGPTSTPSIASTTLGSTGSSSLGPTGGSTTGSTMSDQMQALMDLKNGFTGGFNDWVGWQGTGNECDWSWVICDLSGNVIQLLLYSEGLIGTISPSVGDLTSLSHLHLYTNSLTGTIPGEIWRLSNLLSLRLENNRLSGNIPSTMPFLTSLTRLSLDYNRLTGNVPVLRNSGCFTTCGLQFNYLSDVTWGDNACCDTSYQTP